VKACGAWKLGLSLESGVDNGGSEAGVNSAQRSCRTEDPTPEARLSIPLISFTLILAKNYDENARRADRDSHHSLCSPVDASVP
jgi:hypothetical protein